MGIKSSLVQAGCVGCVGCGAWVQDMRIHVDAYEALSWLGSLGSLALGSLGPLGSLGSLIRLVDRMYLFGRRHLCLGCVGCGAWVLDMGARHGCSTWVQDACRCVRILELVCLAGFAGFAWLTECTFWEATPIARMGRQGRVSCSWTHKAAYIKQRGQAKGHPADGALSVLWVLWTAMHLDTQGGAEGKADTNPMRAG